MASPLRRSIAATACALALSACGAAVPPGTTSVARGPEAAGLPAWAGLADPPPLVPAPRRASFRRDTLVLTRASGVAVEPAHPDLLSLVDTALVALRAWTMLPLPVRAAAAARPGDVLVRLRAGEAEWTGVAGPPTRPGQSSEAYTLSVSADGARVEADAVPGLLHGLRTLDQLVAADGRVAGVEVDDAPRFAYRGLHLDVGRHLFPVDFVLRYVDLLARYKLNAFHWHLTEDQGWRIEIRSRPRLTRVAAFRRETRVGHASEAWVGDGRAYGGYYTQDEVRRVVAYAAERGVTVIPEIELPGHARAALAAYPELGCDPGPFEVATTWGVFEEILCPSEATFRFLEDVLDEVLELFPSELIHIGGDEAPKASWERSSLAQEVMRREGLADEHELQSWFIGRVETYLRSHGRRLMGWDEILDGGLAPDATVMSWRGEAGGIEAARQGHDVVMTPNDIAYLDHYQGDPASEPLAIGGLTTLREIYAWEPVPGELSPTEAAHVLGGQGNVWTEYMKTGAHVEYMVFPRLLALAEVLWSPRGARDLDGLRARLRRALPRLDALGVHYRIPEPRGLDGDRLVLGDEVELELTPPVPGWPVLFTSDGSEPNAGSPRWSGRRRLPVPASGLGIAARVAHPDGRLGPVARARIGRTRLRPATGDSVPDGTLAAGLHFERVEGSFTAVAEMSWAGAAAGVAPEVTLPPGGPPEHFGLRFTGWLEAPAAGVYTFRLTSDDGSRLAVADTVVVDHDGPHGPSERTGQVALAPGLHPVELLYFQAGGGSALRLEVDPPPGVEPDRVRWLHARRSDGPRRP